LLLILLQAVDGEKRSVEKVNRGGKEEDVPCEVSGFVEL
jgi:hypothetical protein